MHARSLGHARPVMKQIIAVSTPSRAKMASLDQPSVICGGWVDCVVDIGSCTGAAMAETKQDEDASMKVIGRIFNMARGD